MKYVIQNREPASVFRFFEKISAIPHGSYNEGGIADYLQAFAAERSLFCYRDALNNILIKKPATPGMESRPALLLQGHTDMVCEKNSDTVHDFLHDPLRLMVDGNLLRADGTTLGGDDGIAVALMLALLDGAAPAHPALECLFTTSEEVGLCGAHGFDYGKINARRMINMDSEQLGVVTTGCAGGVRSELTLSFRPVPFAGEALLLSVRGLAGGHSGECIHYGRANADKLMGRLLSVLTGDMDARLISIEGGTKDNAIPRECRALVAVPDADAASALLTDTAALIASELCEADRGFVFSAEEAPAEAVMLTREDTAHAVAVLACAANGVFEMNRSIPDLVEFSRNLGVADTEEGRIRFVFSSRSAMESRLDASVAELNTLAAVTGCKTKHYNRYPGWKFAPVSPIRDAYLATFRAVTGKDAVVNITHTGLECGVIYSHLPDMDMISVGPTMHDPHTPVETLDLPSVSVFWDVLTALLRM